MYPNTFYAKTALDEAQATAKEAIGCDGLEYQLLPSDFTPDLRGISGRDERLAIVQGHPAAVVHPPLDLSDMDLLLSDGEDAVLEESMRLAQLSADALGARTMVVMHVPKSRLETARCELRRMSRNLERVLDMFPDVDVVLENLPAVIPGRAPVLATGFHDANVRFAELWERAGGGGRVWTCLDICHALISRWYMDAIAGVYGRDGGGSLPIDCSLAGYKEKPRESHQACLVGETGPVGPIGFQREVSVFLDTDGKFHDIIASEARTFGMSNRR